MKKLLIANRGEIAVRIARTAADLGITTVAVYSEDDSLSLHTRAADEARKLTGSGPAAYLDAEQLGATARESECDALHPGYGFLSEDAGLARACAGEGITFVGPSPETLELLGDKGRARALARELAIPVLAGSDGPATVEEAKKLLLDLGPGGSVMLKAISGGGGRGIRPVSEVDRLEEAFERCSSEARGAFGNDAVYVEQFLPGARHIEVQVVGDGTEVAHLWDRECSLQRNRQKIIEVAPAVTLAEDVRRVLLDAAVRLAGAVGYRGLGTVEFLVDRSGRCFFIEANARLQVEHTVTEEVTGLDLVALQLAIADGASLAELGVTQADVRPPRGVALQARVNMETVSADGSIRPTGGVLQAFDPPYGPGVRVDTFGYSGYQTTSRFDSLLAKVIVHAPTGGLAAAAAKAYRALSEFRIEGVETNIELLQNLLLQPAVREGTADTRYIEEHAGELTAAGAHPTRFVPGSVLRPEPRPGAIVATRVDSVDPLAVLAHGKTEVPWETVPSADDLGDTDGLVDVRAPLHGTVILVAVEIGDAVSANQPIVVVEAMKMEHVVVAGTAGTVRAIRTVVGATVSEGETLVLVEEEDGVEEDVDDQAHVDLDDIRPDLAEVLERHHRILDDARPEAVERRRRRGQRTARENIADLCDPGTFVEFAPLTVAARLGRNTIDELIDQTPADGFVSGFGQVNGEHFPPERSRCAVMSYDATVLAGTQGVHGHDKLDRVVLRALEWRMPMVFFTEGGGGRPGDTEGTGAVRSFEYLARLSGSVPLVGVVSGRCFAGNVAMLGCCDVIIATENTTLGMGGPAVVEGAGFGVFRPEEIGPVPVMQRNGVIDVLVEDEAAAVAAAKKYLSYFQGPVADWEFADQRLLRRTVPDNRLRAYDVRRIIELLADTGSVLELRPEFGRSMVTALARIEGRPVGVIANNPQHLAGAVDSDAADKAARFLQICEAFDIPVVSLSDTPGNMVGPEAEKTALIRHCSRLFVIGANLTVPMFAVILRKSYGLGAYAMLGGSPHAPMFCVSWPTGEFGGGSIEGLIKLAYRNELAAIEDPVARKAEYDRMVASAYERSKALSIATRPHLMDDVIDPAETRAWIAAGLRLMPPPPERTEPKVRWIDAW